MVDKEMLSAMSDLLDEKLDRKFDEKLQPVYDRLDTLEQDVSGLKEDVSALKEDVSVLKEDVSKLNDRVGGLEEDVGSLKQSFNSLDKKVDKLEGDMQYVKVVQLENNVIKRLSTIEECYVDASRRYIAHIDKIDRMDGDIVLLKNVVSNHSEQLRRLQG